jgi:hypothetical protein
MANPDEVRQKFFESLESVDNKLSILCCGLTGVGKSTLLNGLFGVDVFEAGKKLTRCTTEVQDYTFTREGVTVTVWDTPGLEGSENDSKYLKEIKGKCADHDIFLYCVDSGATRALDLMEEKSSLVEFTKLFGAELWNKAIVVLTQANIIEVRFQEEKDLDSNFDVEAAFEGRINDWKKKIRGALENVGVRKTIPVALTGAAASPDLPGHPYWMTRAFQMCADQLRYKKLLSLVKVSGDRLKLKKDVNKDEIQRLKIEDQPLVLSPEDLRPTGSAGTEVKNGGVGVMHIMGGGVGAVTGGILGLASGVGIAPGAVIGGTIGSAAGGFVERVLGTSGSLANALALKYFMQKERSDM